MKLHSPPLRRLAPFLSLLPLVALAVPSCLLPRLTYEEATGDTAPGGAAGMGGAATGGAIQQIGGAGGAVSSAPTVVSASPTGALLDGRTPVRIEFSEPVEVGPADVRVVLDTAIQLTGTLEVDGATVTFLPDRPFNDRGTYVVTVSENVRDLDGNPLAEEYVFDFKSLSGGNGGQPSLRLDTLGTGSVACPHLAMDDQGNAMVLFHKGGTLYTAYYRAGVGWEATRELAEGNDAVLAMSPGGRAAVAYTAIVGGEPRILAVMTEGLQSSTFGMPLLADESVVHAPTTTDVCTITDQNKNVAVNDAGAIALMWRASSATSGDSIVGWNQNVKPATQAFGAATFSVTYHAVSYTDMPGIAIDSHGNVESIYSSWSDDSVFRQRSYTAETATWGPLTSPRISGSGSPPRLGVNEDDVFTFAVNGYSFPDAQPTIVADSAEFGGANPTAVANVLLGSGSVGHDLFLSTSHDAWLTWKNGDELGVAGYFPTEDRWADNSSFAAEPGLAEPVIVGVDGVAGSESRAIVLWLVDGAMRWASAYVSDYFIRDAAPVETVPTDGAPAVSARIAYDVPGRHGIILWGSDAADGVELRATEFHRTPPVLP